MPRGPNSRFRFRGKSIFLTFPQCDLEPELVAQQLLSKWHRQATYLHVVKELHEDGSPHIHALFCLTSPLDTTNVQFADLGGFHPNAKYLATTVDIANVDEYLKKDPVLTYVQGALPVKSAKKLSEIRSEILEGFNVGRTSNEMILNPDLQPYFLAHAHTIKQYEAMLKMASDAVLSPFPKLNFSPNPVESRVMAWLARNLDWRDRVPKQKQLYLWSKIPNVGKTSLVSILTQSIRSYIAPTVTHWMDGFDDSYDLLIFEEWAGSFPLCLMNQILDGQNCQIPMRGCTFLKKKNIPVIICSNVPPIESYKNINFNRLHAFEARLEEFELTEFLCIFEHQKRF